MPAGGTRGLRPMWSREAKRSSAYDMRRSAVSSRRTSPRISPYDFARPGVPTDNTVIPVESGCTEATMGDLSEIRFEAIPRTECERLFVAEQPTIKSVVAQVARRYRLSRDETEELASEAALKLIER